MSETRIVWSNGWIEVTLPVGLDPLWSSADRWIYAAAYASAVARGFSQERAIVLAEAIVCKRLYEVTYDKTLEQDLRKVYC
jgi:hypothetical protein